MSNTKKSGTATGTEATAQPKAADLLQNRLQHLAQVQKLVEARRHCQNHVDFLTEQEIEDPNKEFGLEGHEPQKITLHFGHSRGESYDLKNNVLLCEVRKFIVDRINSRMQELDAEILKFNL